MKVRISTSIHLAMVGAAMSVGSVYADTAPTASEQVQARYEHERAACMTGHATEDQATCLKEAAAARDEARRNQLDNGEKDLRANATARCAALAGDERQACEARMAGMGKVTGSVEGGGVLREIKIRKIEPAQSTEPISPPAKTLPTPAPLPPAR